jgi:hypothetical protein
MGTSRYFGEPDFRSRVFSHLGITFRSTQMKAPAVVYIVGAFRLLRRSGSSSSANATISSAIGSSVEITYHTLG